MSNAPRMFPPVDPIQMNGPSPTVETLLAAAMEYAGAAERRAFLDEACAGHPALRQEAESLLSASEQAGNFMTAQAVTAGPPLSVEKAGGEILMSLVPALIAQRCAGPAGRKRSESLSID